jgi:hypothetical protein
MLRGHVRRTENSSFAVGRCVRAEHKGTVEVGVEHASRLNHLVRGRVLDDAQGIDPEVLQAEALGQCDRVPERLVVVGSGLLFDRERQKNKSCDAGGDVWGRCGWSRVASVGKFGFELGDAPEVQVLRQATLGRSAGVSAVGSWHAETWMRERNRRREQTGVRGVRPTRDMQGRRRAS